MHIKKGDNVIILAGSNKGKKGKIVKSIPSENMVVVEGVNMNFLWEKLVPFSGDRLGVIFGIGPGLAFLDEFRLGAAGIIGFDWRITNIVNLQVDWQPTWYFVNGSDFSPINAGFTARYVLNHKSLHPNQ